MEDYLPTQYCVGTKYKKIEILCLDKIFGLEANFAGKQYFGRAQSAILRPDEIFPMDESGVTVQDLYWMSKNFHQFYPR